MWKSLWLCWVTSLVTRCHLEWRMRTSDKVKQSREPQCQGPLVKGGKAAAALKCHFPSRDPAVKWIV